MVNYEYNKDKMQLEVTGSITDLLSAKDSYDHYFTSCRENMQGINTKDTVRYYGLLQKLRAEGETVTDWFIENN